ncbi:trypsin-like peptidase domain-containing protein [Streptomyces halobius]|uniref:Serine protease n=1 Tax=Streptomyces halobius TaxID=2879846 RepID=A0ABY4MDC0_9ACTN|nr:trypsin-like peptidase domain-containing protein [Streptomyces halobius]UQA95312.1 serine protease [Streptomyces halobius]
MKGKAEKPPWQVRVRAASGGAVAGGGTLCANGTVLTCAHVVQQGRGPDGRGGVCVDFPFLERGSGIPARIVLAGEPDVIGGPDDVAVLRPDRIPYGAEPAPMAENTDLAGHTLGAYGFPDGHPDGVWAGSRAGPPPGCCSSPPSANRAIRRPAGSAARPYGTRTFRRSSAW